MNALVEAMALCDRTGESLEELVERALEDGVVYISVDCVVIAERQPEAWFVTLAVGRNTLHRLFALAPHELPLVGWRQARRGRISSTYLPMARLRRLLFLHERQA